MSDPILRFDGDRAVIVMPHHSGLTVRSVAGSHIGREVVIETGTVPIYLDTDTAEILGSRLIDAAQPGGTGKDIA